MIEIALVVALGLAAVAMAAALCVTVVVLARKVGPADSALIDNVVGTAIQAFNNGLTLGQDELARADLLPPPKTLAQPPAPPWADKPELDEPAEIGRV